MQRPRWDKAEEKHTPAGLGCVCTERSILCEHYGVSARTLGLASVETGAIEASQRGERGPCYGTDTESWALGGLQSETDRA